MPRHRDGWQGDVFIRDVLVSRGGPAVTLGDYGLPVVLGIEPRQCALCGVSLAVMDRWRRWRSASSAQRAGVTALAALVVAAGLAVLLAVWFHLDVTPVVVVPVLLALPGLYLAGPHCPAR
jgi:hypothetical protein